MMRNVDGNGNDGLDMEPNGQSSYVEYINSLNREELIEYLIETLEDEIDPEELRQSLSEDKVEMYKNLLASYLSQAGQNDDDNSPEPFNYDMTIEEDDNDDIVFLGEVTKENNGQVTTTCVQPKETHPLPNFDLKSTVQNESKFNGEELKNNVTQRQEKQSDNILNIDDVSISYKNNHFDFNLLLPENSHSKVNEPSSMIVETPNMPGSKENGNEAKSVETADTSMEENDLIELDNEASNESVLLLSPTNSLDLPPLVSPGTPPGSDEDTEDDATHDSSKSSESFLSLSTLTGSSDSPNTSGDSKSLAQENEENEELPFNTTTPEKEENDSKEMEQDCTNSELVEAWSHVMSEDSWDTLHEDSFMDYEEKDSVQNAQSQKTMKESSTTKTTKDTESQIEIQKITHPRKLTYSSDISQDMEEIEEGEIMDSDQEDVVVVSPKKFTEKKFSTTLNYTPAIWSDQKEKEFLEFLRNIKHKSSLSIDHQISFLDRKETIVNVYIKISAHTSSRGERAKTRIENWIRDDKIEKINHRSKKSSSRDDDDDVKNHHHHKRRRHSSESKKKHKKKDRDNRDDKPKNKKKTKSTHSKTSSSKSDDADDDEDPTTATVFYIPKIWNEERNRRFSIMSTKLQEIYKVLIQSKIHVLDKFKNLVKISITISGSFSTTVSKVKTAVYKWIKNEESFDMIDNENEDKCSSNSSSNQSQSSPKTTQEILSPIYFLSSPPPLPKTPESQRPPPPPPPPETSPPSSHTSVGVRNIQVISLADSPSKEFQSFSPGYECPENSNNFPLTDTNSIASPNYIYSSDSPLNAADSSNCQLTFSIDFQDWFLSCKTQGSRSQLVKILNDMTAIDNVSINMGAAASTSFNFPLILEGPSQLNLEEAQSKLNDYFEPIKNLRINSSKSSTYYESLVKVKSGDSIPKWIQKCFIVRKDWTKLCKKFHGKERLLSRVGSLIADHQVTLETTKTKIKNDRLKSLVLESPSKECVGAAIQLLKRYFHLFQVSCILGKTQNYSLKVDTAKTSTPTHKSKSESKTDPLKSVIKIDHPVWIKTLVQIHCDTTELIKKLKLLSHEFHVSLKTVLGNETTKFSISISGESKENVQGAKERLAQFFKSAKLLKRQLLNECHQKYMKGKSPSSSASSSKSLKATKKV